ncbi:MAG: ABC transporter ATP-binding protein [Desulfomonilaceae bacterium]
METGYAKRQVLFDISMAVNDGEIVALIGPNGSGKSTILKAVCGLIPIWKGNVYFDGLPTSSQDPLHNIRRGMVFAPQGHRVFDELTVMENFEIGGMQLPRKELRTRIEYVLQIFPSLRERTNYAASTLSGGEQQMLALARCLIPKPKLLMLDEPSLGLSPKLTVMVFKKVLELAVQTGLSLLIVEQKVTEVLEICHRVYSLKLGRIAFSGHPTELKQDREKLKDLFL